MKLKNLFSSGKIGNVFIKNRIIRSATFVRRAEKAGQVSDELTNFYTELAEGGLGMIITGLLAMDPSGTVSPRQACLYDDSFIPGQKKLVDSVHEHGVKIAAQIAHSGRQGVHPKYPPVAPSPIPEKLSGLTPRELTPEEIKDFIKKFAETSRRAYECGYDMVQMHAAHGYLLSNFLSPYTNVRNDEYGGNTENRTRILVEIYEQIRDLVGKSFPIIIKLQTQDFVPNGLMLDEAKEIVSTLVDIGYDAIEPSGGLGETLVGTKSAYPSRTIKNAEDENYFLPTIKELKPLMKDCKVILMGGIRNPLSAEELIKEQQTNFISMSRPFIYEPGLPNRWKSGDFTPAKCISCNSCYMTMLSGPVHCVVRKKKERRELRKQNRK